MARLFAALKLRLLRNGLRRSPQRIVGLVLALCVVVPVGGLAFVGLAALRGHPAISTEVGVLVFTALTVGWTLLPLLAFGADETLDPARLALLPLSRRELMSGLLVASAVGVPALGTSVVLAGALVGLTGGPGSIAVGVVAIVLELGLCLALSRAVTSALAGLLRSRRGRDLSVVVGALLAVSVQVANLTLQRVLRSTSPASILSVARELRWTPPGLAAAAVGAARTGRYSAALAELALVAGSVVLLLLWWHRTLARASTTVDRSTSTSTSTATSRSARRRRPRPGTAAALPDRVLHGRAGAVAAKELRYMWREPRRKTSWASALLIGALLPVTSAIRGAGLHPVAVFAVCSVALFAGLQSFNTLGLDGAALWINVTSTGSSDDAVADLAGKNLAIAVVAVPALGVLGLGLAALTGGWRLLPAALGIGAAVLGAALAVGNVLSVRAPYPIPDRATAAFAAQGTGRGCLVGLLSLVGLLAVAGLVVPVVAAAVGLRLALPTVAGVLTLVVGIGYGAAASWGSRRIAAGVLAGRLPETLAAVGPRQAA